MLLKVRVYHPQTFIKTQEFVVLGSQSLTVLRDALYCVEDKILDGPHTPSSYFFVEGKFYNDLRDRRAIKYSE